MDQETLYRIELDREEEQLAPLEPKKVKHCYNADSSQREVFKNLGKVE